ncbi:MAG: M2 family metallopeptidase [Ignavibacteria bacterium]|nr:M2 family metallopeptidase [Ignavibacteria bacterium]
MNSLMKIPVSFFVIFALLLSFSGCNKTETDNTKSNPEMVKQFDEFIKTFEAKYIPLYKESTLAYWNASISGKAEDFNKVAEVQNKITAIFSSKEDFNSLKKIRDSKGISDEIKKRELEVIYLGYLGNQTDTVKLNAINRLANDIEQKYGNFRADVNGKKLTDNEIEEVLVTSSDSKELEATWKAHKNIGKIVSADVIKLVKMRNEVAKELGYSNYHEMKLKLSEQDPNEILKLFDELDNLTKDAFKKEKDNIDAYFADRYKIKKEELMPWHYQNRFFQEAPKIYKVDLDVLYKDKDLVKLTSDYYNGIGLPVDDMVKNSDLFEKPGKNQHAFCTDIDNQGDVRVLCNIKPNEKWMNTMLHEYGHAVYDKNIDNKNLPFILRDAAHTFTTEAIAMIFGRFSSNAAWMKDMKVVSEEEAKKVSEDGMKSLRLQQLVFSRWSQVMYRFEKSMYENPDQDLNKLWWDLVEKYQLLKRPEGRNEPDWASKIHIVMAPCYYHNYHMGELLASQLFYYICDNVLKTNDYKNQSFAGKTEVGKYLSEKVFQPGMKYLWNDMIEKATGEKLTAKYYAKQFVN